MSLGITVIRTAAVLLLAALSSAAGAADAAMPFATQTQGAVSFISGGIADEDRAILQPLARKHNVRMAFATTSGEYLSDIRVVMKDTKGKTVLETVSDGPCLLVDAPPGKYSVAAYRLEQRPMVKPVNVSGKRSAGLHFYWTESSRNGSGHTAAREQTSRGSAQHGCF